MMIGRRGMRDPFDQRELGGALASPRTHVRSMRVRMLTASIVPYYFRTKRAAMFCLVLEELCTVSPKAAPTVASTKTNTSLGSRPAKELDD